MSNPASTPWIAYSDRNAQAKLRLFCLPYAGGSAAIYRSWLGRLPSFVNVCSIQLPGRSNRMREAPFTNSLEVAAVLARELRPFADVPFSFFGHSMGGIISFETSRRLLIDYGLRPAHLFISACRAPQCFRNERVFYNLPAAQFIDELRSMKGTPEEVLAHAELVQLLMPMLRADFQLCQTYEYIPGPPLDCPITAFGGLSDEDVNSQQLQAWREQTSSQFSLRMLPGDHFFLHDNEPALLSTLSEEMYRLSERIA